MNGSRPPCQHLPTPKCVQQCRAGYAPSYDKDKHFGKFTASLCVEEMPCDVSTSGHIGLNQSKQKCPKSKVSFSMVLSMK